LETQTPEDQQTNHGDNLPKDYEGEIQANINWVEPEAPALQINTTEFIRTKKQQGGRDAVDIENCE
jgi:hypothetical protein